MINPYEAPQTIERPLPEAVDASTSFPPNQPTKEDLIAALKRLSEAGRLMAMAALGSIVVTMLLDYSLAARGFRNELLQSCLTVITIVTLVFFVWGYFKNLLGYDLAIKQSKDQAFQNLYWMCQLHGWLRLGGGILAFLLLPRINRQPTDRIFVIALCTLAALSLIHTVILHHQAFRWWANRLGKEIFPRGQKLFLVTGIGGVMLMFCGAAYFFENHEQLHFWFAILVLSVLGIAAVAYARLYQKLAVAIASSEGY